MKIPHMSEWRPTDHPKPDPLPGMQCLGGQAMLGSGMSKLRVLSSLRNVAIWVGAQSVADKNRNGKESPGSKNSQKKETEGPGSKIMRPLTPRIQREMLQIDKWYIFTLVVDRGIGIKEEFFSLYLFFCY